MSALARRRPRQGSPGQGPAIRPPTEIPLSSPPDKETAKQIRPPVTQLPSRCQPFHSTTPTPATKSANCALEGCASIRTDAAAPYASTTANQDNRGIDLVVHIRRLAPEIAATALRILCRQWRHLPVGEDFAPSHRRFLQPSFKKDHGIDLKTRQLALQPLKKSRTEGPKANFSRQQRSDRLINADQPPETPQYPLTPRQIRKAFGRRPVKAHPSSRARKP